MVGLRGTSLEYDSSVFVTAEGRQREHGRRGLERASMSDVQSIGSLYSGTLRLLDKFKLRQQLCFVLNKVRFDSDPVELLVESCASHVMSSERVKASTATGSIGNSRLLFYALEGAEGPKCT